MIQKDLVDCHASPVLLFLVHEYFTIRNDRIYDLNG